MEFATVDPAGTHPMEGSLHLYFDQLHIIAKHLQVADCDHKQPGAM
jgi:hypothetical protein